MKKLDFKCTLTMAALATSDLEAWQHRNEQELA
jgi:hypothetical protein